MYKNIAIIGDADSIMGFKSIGVVTRPAATPLEAEEALKDLAGQGCAIIFITENYACEMADAIDAYSDEKLPAIIPVPSITGGTGAGMQNIKKWVERAVGADIITKQPG